MSRYRVCVDAHLVLRRGDEVLLGLRRNTGYADGRWHLPSGHTEAGESGSEATAREAFEEIGVTIAPDDLDFVHLMHHRTNEGRVALFYSATHWEGEPTNREPDKCAELRWFPLTDLPPMIDYAADALSHIAKSTVYSERGWASP